ncbi:ABC transporter permease [Janthinobacterium sp. 17J80-10]|uniref:ABC transporter permease n=1 Tax=Janthinobacterium sp. 17J80-10 TaxID=2497863 RepID=UPI0010055891|nr:ABC transporter permease [Janthinobacterium sp. 17J80-10]QAU33973.1 ABC transporter permease [Janthinobacterium sp. 17J80-10]
MSQNPKTKISRCKEILLGLAFPVAVLLGWESLSRISVEYAYAFVPLSSIGDSFIELLTGGELVVHLAASLTTAIKGFAIGCASGFGIGFLMAFLRPLDLLLNPLLQALRQIPNLALIPLIGLWFGNTEFSKMLIVSLAVFEVMALNAYEGLHQADARLLEVARALKLSRWQTFRRIMVPAAMPSVSIGIQHAVAFAWLSTVGAELLFTVGPGISGVMERAQTGARMDLVIVCLVFIAGLGYAMQKLCRKASDRLLRWRNAAY